MRGSGAAQTRKLESEGASIDVKASLTDIREEVRKICGETIDVLDKLIKRNSTTFIWANDMEVMNHIEKIMQRGGVPSRELSVEQYVRSQRQIGKNANRLKLIFVPRACIIRDSLYSILATNSTVSQDISDFRTVAERIANISSFLEKARPNLRNGKIPDYEALIEVGEKISEVTGTSFDWNRFQFENFENMPSRPDYSHDPETTRENWGRKQVLNSIDELSKSRIKGFRAFYEFCSEFVHPNFGDVAAAASLKELKNTYFNDYATRTTLESRVFGRNDHPGFEYLNRVRVLITTYAFFLKVCTFTQEVMENLSIVLKSAEGVNRKALHRNVKGSRFAFQDNDFCPCGSGRSIRDCLRGR